MMWRLQGSGAIFVCWVSVKLRLLFTAGPYWQVVSVRCAVWIFIDLWNLRPQNACSLSFLRPALKICVKNADFCVNANPVYIQLPVWSKSLYLGKKRLPCTICSPCPLISFQTMGHNTLVFRPAHNEFSDNVPPYTRVFPTIWHF